MRPAGRRASSGSRKSSLTNRNLEVGHGEKSAERVRRVLSKRRDVVEKRMVGGRSFLVNGKMCCGVRGHHLMIRVGPDSLERTLAEPHVVRMKFGNRPLAGFVLIEPEGYRSDAALASWIQRGIDFVSTLPNAGAKKSAAAQRRS